MSKLAKLMSWSIAAVFGLCAAAQAQQPKPIDALQGATGRFQVVLTERSPLSSPADIARHTSMKAVAPEPDYTLSKEVFEAFVPKSPDENGKYGLMVPMPFPAHGFPPATWLDVLEKHHLIWLGHQNGGNTPTISIGFALDAVHNAEKTWPIDPARVYVCPAGTKSMAQGIALYYPDIFQGQIVSAVGYWFDKVADSRTRRQFSVDILNRPTAEEMSLGKKRTRNFFAGHVSADPKIPDLMQLLAEDYTRAGYKYSKFVLVPQSDMTLWTHYPSSWFEQGVEYLDAGAAEANAAPKTVAAPKPAPMGSAGAPAAAAATPGAGATPPADAAPSDTDVKAASALRLAKSYVNANQYETARKKLETLIQTYPTSASTAEAKSLLEEIKGK